MNRQAYIRMKHQGNFSGLTLALSKTDGGIADVLRCVAYNLAPSVCFSLWMFLRSGRLISGGKTCSNICTEELTVFPECRQEGSASFMTIRTTADNQLVPAIRMTVTDPTYLVIILKHW